MLNRRLLRIKIFQALYSYFQSHQDDLNVALKNLFTSLHKMHELVIRNIFFIIKISELIDERFENNKKKFLKVENVQELKRLSNHHTLKMLCNNSQLKKLIETYNITITGFEDALRKIARTIEESSEYQEYQITPGSENNLNFLKQIYKKYIYNDEVLLSLLEEMNLHWVNDQHYAGIILMSYIKKESFLNSESYPIPNTFKEVDFEDAESDEDFVKILFTKTILGKKEYDDVIFQYLENWDPDRIALSDMIIMRMACAEIIHFSQIPVKVSLNEYIELTKIFSTPKSKIFVNGVLDKVISHFHREGKFEKIGRGLLDN